MTELEYEQALGLSELLETKQLTPEFLKMADRKGVVWLRDEYIATFRKNYPDAIAAQTFMSQVELVKRQTRESGHQFSA